MNKKDFEVVSSVMLEVTEYANYRRSQTVRDAHALNCEALSAKFKTINPRFDRVKFLKACGLSENTIENL
jgi:hypothetical protein